MLFVIAEQHFSNGSEGKENDKLYVKMKNSAFSDMYITRSEEESFEL